MMRLSGQPLEFVSVSKAQVESSKIENPLAHVGAFIKVLI
jgi:hypothetical protein